MKYYRYCEDAVFFSGFAMTLFSIKRQKNTFLECFLSDNEGMKKKPEILPDPEIVFEDMNVLVLCKPAGWLSQGALPDDPNIVDWLRVYLGRYYVGLIHRLDRNTSGLMLIAKRTKAAHRLTEALQNGEVRRIYQAFLIGDLKQARSWRHFLSKDEESNQVRAAEKKFPGSQEASLIVTPLEHFVFKGKNITWAQFELATGRSHQIRVQAAAEGFPLLGDIKYGARTGNLFPRPALHSADLEFPHPISGERLRFSSPLPEDMAGIKGAALK